MIMEEHEKFTKLIAAEGKRITNKNRTFFAEFIYLGKKDKVENYIEVGKEIWMNALKKDITTEDRIKELEETVKALRTNIFLLEDIILENDYRLLKLENDDNDK